ncbi:MULTISPECIES: aminotransferase class V-fold PLP-dependent enzyme [Xanthomonas]|uniref:Aminotransferase class V-fold PLP-dependent enzyme n=1 Tax=Xanthomonas cucurbitae TaxID=56453 RepID=A0A2S7DXL6_9XANT|nr:aminotransferase class V-fold PLP-dependent enzyme [Xanthomonas cucurbitae]PPU78515.1 selenocysteine lyase [Xanthomonas cucurbitae]QHG88782.1 aminotransferase class V-fold PLP-dependent enzyme [Xanthomonas cucurbitae]WDM67658.1 aminotransferase class V-fold PLP-dependent enzyme [Xanthomonas cucurbitae]WDM71534.1 aminotransferase class V-fold PLP-dependent enzyme [Xanthomonas cucurbitae]WDM75379.1 aminotransferase class V-fold PLP-dependent enzyme [Xanthomonas cucurbitae]
MSSPLLSSPLPIPLDWAHRQQAFALPDELVYLDAASRGPLLRAVQQVAHQAVDALATPWRLPFDAWLQQIEQLRTLAAGLFDHDADAVALLPSAAHGLATAARNLPLQRGDAVLVLEGQFPSNLLIWQRRCAEVGGRIVAVPTSTGTVLTDAVLQAIAQTPALRIASLPQAYWLDGRQLDLDRISAALQARGAALVLDLSQSLGVLPNDLPRWKPEFVVSVGHKWLLGPMGLAWLWAAPHWRAQGVPIEEHWLGRDAGSSWEFPSAQAPQYRDGARRFDAGGVADPLRIAMATVALQQVSAWQPVRIGQALGALTAQWDAALQARGLGSWCPAGHAPHLTALQPPAWQLETVAKTFGELGAICTRRHGRLRIAPHVGVAEDALLSLVAALPDQHP